MPRPVGRVDGGKKVILVAAGFGVPILLLAAGIGFLGDSSPRLAPSINRGLDENPYVNGEETTLEAAEKALGGHVVRPQSDLASDSNIAHVWVDNVNARVAIYYESGVLLTVQPAGDTDASPQEQLSNQEELVAAQDGASVILDVNGITAVGTEQNYSGNSVCGTPGADCIPAQENPSAISMVLIDDSIELLAYVDLESLTKVATTIA